MAIINTNPNIKDVVILQRDDTNTYYGETHISGSDLIIYIDSNGYLNADTSASFYSQYPPPGGGGSGANGTASIVVNYLSAPASPAAGQIYFNSTDSHFYGYNGTAWKRLDNGSSIWSMA